MKEKEIIEGNKLIAEFMGLPIQLIEEEHEYNTSWRTLMPVVLCIEELEEIDRHLPFDANGTAPRYCTPYRVDILGRNVVEVLAYGEDSICLINQDGLTKIEALYKAVIQFIQWYNTNTPKP